MRDEFNLYEGRENYIFVSYSHKDKDRVFPVLKKMIESGYRIWFDKGIHPGSQWPEIVAGHLARCTVFMVFISDHYMQSQNCIRELHFAVARNKSLISIMLQPVLLTPGVEMQLCVSQAVRHYEFPTEEQFYKVLNTSAVLEQCQRREELFTAEELPVTKEKEGQPEQIVPQKMKAGDASGEVPAGSAKTGTETFRQSEKEHSQRIQKSGKRNYFWLVIIIIAALGLTAAGVGMKVYHTVEIDGEKYSRKETSLTVADKRVTEELIQKLKSFSKLHMLDFKNCTFEPQALDGLGELQELTQLKLEHCENIENLTFVNELTGLYRLELSDCGINNKSFDQIKSSDRLQVLTVSGNPELSEIEWLSHFPELSSLKLERNSIRDVAFVSELENLGTLSLAENKIEKISSPFKSLRISNLDLSDNQITDFSGLDNLTVLTKIDISGNDYSRISDKEGLKCITKSAAVLKIADLSGNDFSQTAIERMFADCTQLKEVHIDDNKSLTTLEMFSKGKELETITASGCGLKKLGNLTGCRGLKSMNLSDNQLGSLSGFPKITASSVYLLDLSGNQLTDLDGLDGGTSYQKLILYGNKWDEKVLNEVLAGLKGNYLGISYIKGLKPESVKGFISCYMEGVPDDQKVIWEDALGSGCHFERMQITES
ncbi:Internalin-A precursor [uncultured Roseburia sp.]|uniref:TIR domain-containing protein n=1 Tax=Brotonthovivens ammoniilytica TaxID=2981725 RepID=A0ABT2TGR0_9FIRM|nr:TIR domain-containing protein [Brotonthovivens ammoniilytica]MCU6761096.1 TIR domain-containing protein [Brotonthovivens ammoniilytica]SCI18714.1 Internalin-A precursor [uncultured Roseburia sp.]